jgi:hypothetical protein
MKKKITKKTLKDLDKRIAEAKDLKQKIFLMATRNSYSKQLGLEPPYKW